MAHRVDAPQRIGHGVPVPYIGDDHSFPAAAGTPTVRRLQQRIEHDHLMAARDQRLGDVSPDEPGSAGEQYAHDATLDLRARSAPTPYGHVTGA